MVAKDIELAIGILESSLPEINPDQFLKSLQDLLDKVARGTTTDEDKQAAWGPARWAVEALVKQLPQGQRPSVHERLDKAPALDFTVIQKMKSLIENPVIAAAKARNEVRVKTEEVASVPLHIHLAKGPASTGFEAQHNALKNAQKPKARKLRVPRGLRHR